ncbi:MAG: response regulator transcription factor [bacterium]
MKKITVVLADDHSVVREGLQMLLQAEDDMQVVGQAETGSQAVELAQRLRPDVVVMDIAMPLLNGLNATRQIRQSVPDTRVLILSAYSNPSCIDQVVALGAAGYLIKNASIRILAQAIRQVIKGVPFFDPSIVPPVSCEKATRSTHEELLRESGITLTPREASVLQLIADGFLNKQVADKLGISAKTAEKHRYSLMKKLGIHDTAGLTRYAIASGVSERI